MKIHIARDGETIREIAEEYGQSPSLIAGYSGIDERARLSCGEEILILTPRRTVLARRGDTLGGIAKRYSASVTDLEAYNPRALEYARLPYGMEIALGYECQDYGMGITNGYYYPSCRGANLKRAMPYLTYVTVAGAIYDGGALKKTIRDSDLLDYIKEKRKIPTLRIYLRDTAREDEISDLARSIILLARGSGYNAVTLGGIGKMEYDVRLELVRKTRQVAADEGIKLFIEEPLDSPLSLGEYADGVILFHDKTNKERVPSFEEDEGALMNNYETRGRATRSFIDLTPFAYGGGRFIPKIEIRERMHKRGAVIQHIAEGDAIAVSINHTSPDCAYVYESLANTYKKLKCVSELGFFGISFDINLMCTEDLLLFRSMFTECTHISE